MEKKTFDIFNMSCPIDQLVDIETKFELLRSMDAYDDTELYVSKETFKHDLDEELKFDYKYFIEAYHYTEEGENRTYYTLYLVPMFNSLADKRKNNVAENAGDPENATAEDVFDYGSDDAFDKIKPGDMTVNSDNSHIGMIVDVDYEKREVVVAHCSGSGNGMNLTRLRVLDDGTTVIVDDSCDRDSSTSGTDYFTKFIHMNYKE